LLGLSTKGVSTGTYIPTQVTKCLLLRCLFENIRPSHILPHNSRLEQSQTLVRRFELIASCRWTRDFLTGGRAEERDDNRNGSGSTAVASHPTNHTAHRPYSDTSMPRGDSQARSVIQAYNMTKTRRKAEQEGKGAAKRSTCTPHTETR